MLLYLLLIAFFGLVVLASIGTSIFGLVKKRKKVLVTAAVLFATGVLGCVFAGFMYTRKAFDYVQSGDFQEDAKKGSTLVGQTLGSVSSGVSEGLAITLDDEAIARLAHKSATILGKSVKTIASGLDSTVGNKSIFLDQSLADTGLELGRADERYNAKAYELGIFIDYTKDFQGKLRITNYDQTGKKIDVAEKDITAKAGQGKVEVFRFPHSNLGITTYFIVSKE
jgi:hypothetical protein